MYNTHVSTKDCEILEKKNVCIIRNGVLKFVAIKLKKNFAFVLFLFFFFLVEGELYSLKIRIWYGSQDTSCTATCLPSRKLYKLDEPDTLDTAGEARTNSSVMYSYGPPHMAKQKQDDQLEHTYSSYVRIRDVALETCQKR